MVLIFLIKQSSSCQRKSRDFPIAKCELERVPKLWLVNIANSHFIALECDLGCLPISIATPELHENFQSPLVMEAQEMVLMTSLSPTGLRFQ